MQKYIATFKDRDRERARDKERQRDLDKERQRETLADSDRHYQT